MRIKGEIQLDISNEEARQICVDYLRSCLPYDSEIRCEGCDEYWFARIYDARWDKIISLQKGEKVTERDKLIQKLLTFL